MSCKSPSVQRTAEKAKKALEQVTRLENELKSREAEYKKEFYKEIDEHLAKAGIKDALELIYNKEIKSEYSYEFSIDKITDAVKKALEAVATNVKQKTDADKSLKPEEKSIAAIALSEESVKAYCDLVTSISEAAKSSSKTSQSISFSMVPISPGVIAFLSAKSSNITDNETFGTEAVTSTAVFYRVVISIDALKRQAEFIAAQATIQEATVERIKKAESCRSSIETLISTIERFKALQVGLVDDIAAGKLTVKSYMLKDQEYGSIVTLKEKALKQARKDLEAYTKGAKFNTMSAGAGDLNPKPLPEEHMQVLKMSLTRLSKLPDVPKEILEVQQQRINNYYY